MRLDKIKKHLEESREVILKGGVNCIPSPFPRFREQFPGIRKKFYYLISGGTKSSKTQITNYIFIINSIFYYINNPDKINPTIHIFPLEETEEDISLRFYAYVINYLSGGKYNYSPEDLESIDERNPLPKEVLELMDTQEFIDIIKVFEEHVIFHTDRNPTGIWKVMKTYMEEHGTLRKEKEIVTYKDDWGQTVTKEIDKTVEYIPNDPTEYVMFIVDHVGLLSPEVNNGKIQTLKEAIEKLSEYCVILRNKYSTIPIIVQQQNSESTNLEAFKANRIRPTKDGLKDSKRTGEDCTVLLGITNPNSFNIPDYLGYNILSLKDSFRVLEVVLSRKGRANGLCPLYFDGAINNYKEIPAPKDPQMNDVYKYIEEQRKKRSARIYFIKSNNKINNKGLQKKNIILNFVAHLKKSRSK